MPKEFCKLFHAVDVGQVLVILESDENGDPAVNVKFRIGCMADMTAMAGLITSFSGENMGFDKEEDAETWAWEQAEKHSMPLPRSLPSSWPVRRFQILGPCFPKWGATHEG